MDLSWLDPRRRALLALVDAAEGEPARIPRRAGAAGAPAPMSFGQERLWFLEHLQPGQPMYVMLGAVALPAPCDLAALGRSLDLLVRRHEALRTRFDRIGDAPVQIVQPPSPVAIAVTDLRGAPADAAAGLARRAVSREAEIPFDLAQGRLLRVHLIRMPAGDDAVVLALHHIASDGWTLTILARELREAYTAVTAGQPWAPPPPLQCADVAAWERARLSGHELERLTAGWRALLAGAPARSLPATDHPPPRVESGRGASRGFLIEAAHVGALERTAASHGTTLFAVLLAALAALLRRHGAGGDLVIGTPVANRDRVELEDVVGFLVNTVPIRIEADLGATAAAGIAHAGDRVAAAMELAALPFDRIVDAVQPARDLGHNPLFQVMLALQNLPGRDRAVHGLPAAGCTSPEPCVARFALGLFFAPHEGALIGSLEYATDLFEHARAAWLIEGYRAVLAAIAADPEVTLAAATAPPPAEQAQLAAWSAGPAPDPAPAADLVSPVLAMARAHTDAPALEADGEVLTYRELAARAAGVAAALRAAGIGGGAEDCVAVCAARGPWQGPAVLGTLLAGAACVPIDPALPPARIAQLLEAAGAAAAVTGPEAPGVAAVLARCGVREVRADLVGRAPVPARAELDPARLAYVIFTSGSTGAPKGVAMSHGAVANLISWQLGTSSRESAHRTAQFAPLGFDVAFQELFATWSAGACLVVVPGEVRTDPVRLGRFLAERRITRAFLPPIVLRELAAAAPEGLALRSLIIAGEALHVTPAVAALCERGGIELVNQYGPTETHVATWHALGSEPARWPAWPPIGRPIAGHRVEVLDEASAPVPIGAPGELYLAGAGVARGYLGRPEATAARFVPDPRGAPGARMYRTGDLARWRCDGTLEFLGRGDDQVKVSGFRVELGEVETALRGHPAVGEVAAAVRPGAGGSPRLVAYVTARAPGGAPPAAGELRAYLRERLPVYMVPEAIAAVERIPRLTNGKIDRAALPSPEPSVRNSDRRRPPRTKLESQMVAIWRELLEVDVGLDDDFFELGGSSLAAMRLVGHVRQVLDLELEVRALFEAPTVARLCERLGGRAGARAATASAGGAVGAGERVEDPAGERGPLSPAQERLWFLDRLAPGASTYCIGDAIRLAGALDAAALAAAWRELVERHPALRTRFAVRDGEPEQVVEPATVVELPVLDLAEVPPSMREAELAAIRRRERARAFSLEAAPPVRAVTVVLDAAEHALVVTLHHIVVDGWSLGVIARELRAIYDRRRGRPAPPLPPAPPPYLAYARRAREALDAAAVEAHLAFWRAELAGAPLELALPLDRPRTGEPVGPGAVQSFAVPAPLRDGLLALAREQHATPFMALLAVVQALLARYTGTRDVVVGAPVADRAHAELEGAVGFFVNTLVLRARFGPEVGLRGLVRVVRERMLAALAHQALPFERLVAELQPARDPGVHPLFQVMCFLDDLARPGPAAEAPPAPAPTLEPPPPDDGVLRFREVDAKFDLSFGFEDTPAGLVGVVEYRSDRFDHRTIWRMIRYWLRLLESALAAPDAPLEELALHRGDELADETAPRAVGVPGAPATLGELWARSAAAHAERPAVAWDGGALSYWELAERACRVAGALAARGVAPGDLVAIALPRGHEQIAAVLGALAVGATYVPLDPVHPDSRTAELRRRAAAVISAAADAAEPGALWIEDALAAPAGAAQAVRLDPEAAAYVIHTSGSTGTPHGVVVEHRAAAAYAASSSAAFGLGPSDRVLLFASPAVDVAVEEVFATLAAGATLVARPDSMLDAPAHFLAACRTLVPTVLILPTAYWHELVPELVRVELPPAVRLVVIGGEQASSERLAAWTSAVGDRVRLVNAYGPTEATVSATYAELTGGGEPDARVPIGRSVATAICRVLDGALRPVPIGLPGELHIGGPAVARGYLDQPVATAERFLPDPWGPPGARMYRTGDRVRRRGDGALEFLGRIDEQVKVRGFRIELGDVEAALRGCPGVAAAAAALRPPRGDLVAAVAPASLDGDALRAALSERLPGYAVPARIAAMDALPMLASGKVDRRRIAALAEESGAAPPGSPPRDAREAAIAAIWAEVLRAPALGIHDDFFRLGGHSLLAAQVVARLRDRLGIEITIRRLFEARTIAALTAALGPEADGTAAGSVEALPPAGSVEAPPVASALARTADAPAPASFAQERLWFVDRVAPGAPLYNLPLRLPLAGPVSPAAWRRALAWLIERHEVLRTRFGAVDGRPVQIVEAVPADPLVVVDLRDLPPGQRGIELERIADAEARESFDLDRGPPLRAMLVRVRDDEHVLLLTLHHIAGDGWSLEIVRRELAAAYEAAAAGRAPELPPLPMQYVDFAAWQRAHLAGPREAELLAWWRRELDGAPRELPLPVDRPRPAVRDHEGRWQMLSIPASVVRRIEELGRRRGATAFMVLLAGFEALLHRWTGARDIVVGTPVAGRDLAAAEGLIGFFVNTLPLRLRIAPGDRFEEVLAGARDACAGALAHQALPFERLVEELQPERSLALSPVFQVVLAFQDLSRAESRERRDVPDGFVGDCVAKYDLTVSLDRDGDRMVGYVEYARALFDDATIRRLADGYAALLAAAVTDPARVVADLPAASAADLAQLAAWGQGPAPGRPADLCADVRRWALLTPHAVAVRAGEDGIAYAELVRGADAIAAWLRAAGVGLGDPVILVLPRSPAYVAAALGAMFVGAVYVPVDPAYPAERIELVVEDAGARAAIVAPSAERSARLPAGVPVLALPPAGVWPPVQAPVQVPLPPDRLAYIVYTSGSTGRPKGAANTAAGIGGLCAWYRDRLGLDHRDRVTAIASPGFDAAVAELWPALAAGASIEIPTDETRASPAALAAWLCERRITMSFLPTPLAESFFDVALPEDLALRWLLTGGDRLTRFPPEGARYRLLNQYGPTECTVCATACEVPPSGAGVPPIGAPMAGVRIELVDEELRPVPPGAVGELVIAGSVVGAGYWRRPEVTAGRFVLDPDGPPGARRYRTGDLARWHDGVLEFKGRNDRQVKLRGFRIEPGEIEHAISEACGAPAAVLVAPGDALIAFVADPEVSPGPVLATLRRRLPPYMVPSRLVPVARLPVTSHGKLAVEDLAALSGEAAPAEPAPRDPVALELAALWDELLSAGPLRPGDDFFALGGHSLLLTQLAARIRAGLGVEVPLRALFENATLERMSGEVLVRLLAQLPADEVERMLREVARA